MHMKWSPRTVRGTPISAVDVRFERIELVPPSPGLTVEFRLQKVVVLPSLVTDLVFAVCYVPFSVILFTAANYFSGQQNGLPVSPVAYPSDVSSKFLSALLPARNYRGILVETPAMSMNASEIKMTHFVVWSVLKLALTTAKSWECCT